MQTSKVYVYNRGFAIKYMTVVQIVFSFQGGEVEEKERKKNHHHHFFFPVINYHAKRYKCHHRVSVLKGVAPKVEKVCRAASQSPCMSSFPGI